MIRGSVIPRGIGAELEGIMFDAVNHNVRITNDEAGSTVKVNLAGYSREEIKLDFDETTRTLNVAAEKVGGEKKEDAQHGFFGDIFGVPSGKFDTTLNVGHGLNADALTAEYKDGILTVTIPKADRNESKRSIEIS